MAATFTEPAPRPRGNALWRFFGALRVLASRWRASRVRVPVSGPSPGLGVGALPDGVHQLPRGVPAALVARDARSAALWFPALLADGVSASSVFLLAPSLQWADQLLTDAALHSAHARGQLLVWVLAPGLQPLLRTHGLAPLLQELQSVGLRPHHAVYVMDAQRLFAGLDVLRLQRVGEQLCQWCRKRQLPVVLGFFPPSGVQAQAGAAATATATAATAVAAVAAVAAPAPADSHADVLPMLQGLGNMALHIATLDASAESFHLQLARWNGRSGAVFQAGFGLALDPQTRQLQHDGSCTWGQDQALIEAPDQRAVIATRSGLSHQAGVPAHWQLVDTLEGIVNAAAHSIGATVLLDAGDSSTFEALARLVHHLRLTRPATLKIVVCESTRKLRSHSEQALLELGANAVLYRELGFSRLLRVLQDLQSHSYTRPLHPDYQQALDAFMPAPVHGYQPAPAFSRLVRDMLQRTQGMGLGHSMVRLDLAPQMAHLTALRACTMVRDGDLVTAGRSAVYVFLFACRAPDIAAALDRLFTVPVAQLFTAQSTDDCTEGMLALLDGLDSAARQGLPDYSALLSAAVPALTTGQDTPAEPAEPAEPAALADFAAPVEPVEPVAVVEVAQGMQPLQPGPLAEAVEPGKTIEAIEAAEPVAAAASATGFLRFPPVSGLPLNAPAPPRPAPERADPSVRGMIALLESMDSTLPAPAAPALPAVHGTAAAPRVFPVQVWPPVTPGQPLALPALAHRRAARRLDGSVKGLIALLENPDAADCHGLSGPATLPTAGPAPACAPAGVFAFAPLSAPVVAESAAVFAAIADTTATPASGDPGAMALPFAAQPGAGAPALAQVPALALAAAPVPALAPVATLAAAPAQQALAALLSAQRPSLHASPIGRRPAA